MTAVPLGVSTYIRKLGADPEVIINNLLIEKDPSNLVDQLAHLQRPGLVRFASLVSNKGGVNGVFRQRGVFDDDYLAVCAGKLFRIDAAHSVTAEGQIPVTGRVQFAASATRVLIATGTQCYSYNGSALSSITMPGNVDVQSVAYLDGYFILTQTDSGRFWWIAPGETDPDGLSFANAESMPDSIVHVERLGDELWFFGQGNSTEVWVPTGNADLPFKRVGGRVFNQGCLNRDAVAQLDNTVFWVGSDGAVYRAAGQPMRISDNSLEELIATVDRGDLRAWAFVFQGHALYCLTVGSEGTRVYDASTGTWGTFSSYGFKHWRAHVGAQVTGHQIVAGDSEDGILWRLDGDVNTDGGKPLIREVIGGVAVLGSPQICSSLVINVATGQGNSNPPGDTPVLQMRFSDDGGNTYSQWFESTTGKKGHYGHDVVYQRLGQMKSPGRLFWFRFSEDCRIRFSYARCNEYVAG
jgi:hypothetical protein